MTEIERIRDQIERAHDGDPWCGPSLLAALGGVTAEQAAARAPGLAHSIGEIVLHVAAWQEVVADRVAGRPVAAPAGGEWPGFGPPGGPGWRAALGRLAASHRALLAALATLDPAGLDGKVGDARDPALGSGMTAYATLHGVAQHAMYHAGQVAPVKRLVGPL